MSDATKKQNWNIYYFWRVGTFFSPSVSENFFPYVVASLTFERRFCWGGLCFLTSGSGIFRCWLWIISCNDGSAWHVCLDSMPSSLSTDQTELSYCLLIETDSSINRFKLSFIRTRLSQRRRQPTAVPVTVAKQRLHFWSESEGVSLSRLPIIGWEVRLKVRGHKWLLVSTHQEFCGHGPYSGHKSCFSADQRSQNPIFYQWTVPVSFLSLGDVPQIRVIAFLIQLEEPFLSL